MNVLVIEPMKAPYEKETQSGLESLYKILDTDTIEAVYPFEDKAAICDENSKLIGKELNRALRDDNGDIYDIIAGTFIIAGLDDENFTSLTNEQVKKYEGIFKTPEAFVRIGGKLLAVSVEEGRPSVMEKLNTAKESVIHKPSTEHKHNRGAR